MLPIQDGSAEPGENRLLAALPVADYNRILARSEDVSFRLKEVVYRANGPVDSVYFCRSGVLSMIIIMDDGGTVEVGTVGNEGFAGVPAYLGAGRSPTQVFCQVPVTAWRMTAAAFHEEVARSDALDVLLKRYTQSLLNQVSQSTACNQLHSVEERCSRWLLATHDRVGGGAGEFILTQEFLALMLGVRRASVTVAAGMLQRAGLIRYRRGHVVVVDRGGLENVSCECYRTVRDETDRLLP